ncbi:hypothetical protein DXT99_05515 [Pontibacter diazotrophicus]|uniref:Uncharacterized protein n=1 Tax=Pontibacter diazotrophicus TaxID=1400979 RepID=A0A3D8LFB1_9BACT|nr:hypothetical protein [Pontibacter diazotrophicus]RDV16129.1 hypothetical protein DXT99_05515 [Pontibacter diazotrophicus]
MARQLEQVKQKGVDRAEWQRLYACHQQEYEREHLRAIKAAMAHTSLRGLRVPLDCSPTTFSDRFYMQLPLGHLPLHPGAEAANGPVAGEKASSELTMQFHYYSA